MIQHYTTSIQYEKGSEVEGSVVISEFHFELPLDDWREKCKTEDQRNDWDIQRRTNILTALAMLNSIPGLFTTGDTLGDLEAKGIIEEHEHLFATLNSDLNLALWRLVQKCFPLMVKKLAAENITFPLSTAFELYKCIQTEFSRAGFERLFTTHECSARKASNYYRLATKVFRGKKLTEKEDIQLKKLENYNRRNATSPLGSKTWFDLLFIFAQQNKSSNKKIAAAWRRMEAQAEEMAQFMATYCKIRPSIAYRSNQKYIGTAKGIYEKMSS